MSEDVKAALASMTRWPSTVAGFACLGLALYFNKQGASERVVLVMGVMAGVLINAKAVWLFLQGVAKVAMFWRKGG